jgi:hypothetical protein
MDELSGSISKEWVALILLPMMNCIAGGYSVSYSDFASDEAKNA